MHTSVRREPRPGLGAFLSTPFQYLPKVGIVRLLRPGYLAIAFTAYFGVVAYLAYQVARQTTAAWYTPAISQSVYQTTMVGGVLVLAGLFITASLLPQLLRPSHSTGVGLNSYSRSGPSRLLSDAAFVSRSQRGTPPRDPHLAVEDLLDESEFEAARYRVPRRVQDAAAVSSALSRMRGGAESAAAGTLMDRLSDIRARNSVEEVSERRPMERTLVRLVSEIKPLLIAAKYAGLDVPEIQRLVTEATAGREGDLVYRVRLVENMKGTLEAALAERIGDELQSVLRDIERAKIATNQVHDAELAAAEAVALLDTGNYAGAFDRAARARETFETKLSPVPARMDWIAGPSSFAAFFGPSIAAAMYVGIAAMLLPGVGGFLEANFVLNTSVILFLSYGWFGLILYALISIYIVSRSPSLRAISDEMADRER